MKNFVNAPIRAGIIDYSIIAFIVGVIYVGLIVALCLFGQTNLEKHKAALAEIQVIQAVDAETSGGHNVVVIKVMPTDKSDLDSKLDDIEKTP